jgi:hypothetical protein
MNFAAKMKSGILSAAMLASMAAVPLFATTTTAHATPYGDCVRATWDPIGCWLNPKHETWGGVTLRDPKLGNPEERAFKRAEAMMDAGVFKNYSDLGNKAISGAVQQNCNLNELLALVEEKKDVSVVGNACYFPVRSGGAAGKVSLPNLIKR